MKHSYTDQLYRSVVDFHEKEHKTPKLWIMEFFSSQIPSKSTIFIPFLIKLGCVVDMQAC